jgi:MFS family permease
MRSMNEPTKAVVLGFVAAPVVPAIAFAVVGAVVGAQASVFEKLGIAALVYVYALSSLIFAVPAFAILNRRGKTGLVVCVVSGGAIGSIFAALIASPVLSLLPLWAGSGAGAGCMFWLVRASWMRARVPHNES